MKKMLLFTALILGFSTMYAQPMKLNAPSKQRGSDIMKALQERKSIKEYADKKLSTQDLSDLLWAANGINRPESGKRTAPSAMNRQEIDIYVCMADGAYIYDHKAHALNPVSNKDLRPLVAGGQAWAATAPVCLVLVGNLDAFKGEVLMPAVDCGIVSQNISLFCSGIGLATVPRGTMKQAELKAELKLKDSQRLLLNHPVGHAK